MDNRPIGVFDSGLGGLTVLSELAKLMPNENFIYFGDTARVPYGSKSKNTIIEYSRQIVSFLIKQNVKMVVIACGTASSLAYETIKSEFNIPIIDVILPTANNLSTKCAGIIATNASIKSGVWKNKLKTKNPSAKIYEKACPLFVPIVEERLINSKLADDAIELYLSQIKKRNIDALILGCTHYPLLYEKIKSYLPATTRIININSFCAKKVKKVLEAKSLNAKKTNKQKMIAFTTDDVKNFKDNSKKFCNIEFTKVEKAIL